MQDSDLTFRLPNHRPTGTGPALAACCALLLAGCGKPSAPSPTATQAAPLPPPTHVLAEVGGQPITEEAFRSWWNRKPRLTDSEEARLRVLDEMIDRTVLAQRAREAGLADDPIVREGIESILIARLKEKELQPRVAAIDVTEEEARAFYEANCEARYVVPARVNVAVLWFNSRGQEQLETRYGQQLRAVLDAVKSAPPPLKAGFAKLSLQNTEHRPSRYKGGDLGWLEPGGNYDPWRLAVLDIAGQLDTPGDLSEVVVSQHGCFLVRLLERRARGVRDFEAVKASIVHDLQRERRQAAEAAFLAKARTGLAVQRHDGNTKHLTGLKTRQVNTTTENALFTAEETR